MMATITVVISVVVACCLVLAFCVKVVSGNEILVVTGIGATKKVKREVTIILGDKEIIEEQMAYEPKIKIAGACVVVPFIQKSRTFDICVETFSKDGDTIKTVSGVEIDIDWVISYAPNAETIESVKPAIRQFLDKTKEQTREIISNVVAGGVRAVVSTMTPREVMVGKETLDDAVQRSISVQMADLGYKVQLYIQEVRDSDNSTYLHDIAAQDREETRRNAANITAENDQSIREKKAQTERASRDAELQSELQIAEMTRNNEVQKAQYKVETDKARADADIAGQLREAERQKELATNKGQIEVEKQVQENYAAEKRKNVVRTNAEADKIQVEIDASAQAEKAKINAEAKASVMQTEASGQAEAARRVATGQADAVKVTAEAEASRITRTGTAEADIVKVTGLAEAEAIKAKGLSEAAAEKALAEARAANDGVNLKVALAEIQRDTEVQVSTNFAAAMAHVGEKAQFIDMGGSSRADGSDLLTRVLGNLPGLVKQLNVANSALNEEPFNKTINELVHALVASQPSLSKKTDKDAGTEGDGAAPPAENVDDKKEKPES